MRKRVVFLGTPSVVVQVLDSLAMMPDLIQLRAVITQPPARSSRGSSLSYSPVHLRALELGIPILTPENASDTETLETLKALKIDLCVTAAFGQVLSDEFLAIPKFGTLNVHPSLLPKFRGAAPVQRAVESGLNVTGVTLAFSVRAMDAGPIACQCKVDIDPDMKAPQLLNELFAAGCRMLKDTLPQIFLGDLNPRPQNHELATKAKKLKIEDSWLNFSDTALEIHNKVRAYADWPGTRARFLMSKAVVENTETLQQRNDFDGQMESVEVKIVTTRVDSPASNSSASFAILEKPEGGDAPEVGISSGGEKRITMSKKALQICCGGGSVLHVIELQLPGKKVITAQDFWNGLKNRQLFRE